MLNFGNKEFRNLQEQVGKNQEDIATLKTGIKFEYWVNSVSDLVPLTIEENIGKWIAVGSGSDTRAYTICRRVGGGLIATSFGKYPAEGPQGQKGETGDTGATGRNPKLVVGYWPLPQDDSYQYRDVFILRADAGVYHKGDLFQKDNYGNWQLMFNLVGPQGVPASEGDEVVANPEGVSAVDQLNTVLIDGVCYGVYGLSAAQQAFVASLAGIMAIDSGGSVEFGHNVYADGNVTVGSNLQVYGGIEDTNGEPGEQGQVLTSNGQEEVFWETPYTYTKLYKHQIKVSPQGNIGFIVSTSPTAVTTIANLVKLINSNSWGVRVGGMIVGAMTNSSSQTYVYVMGSGSSATPPSIQALQITGFTSDTVTEL